MVLQRTTEFERCRRDSLRSHASFRSGAQVAVCSFLPAQAGFKGGSRVAKCGMRASTVVLTVQHPIANQRLKLYRIDSQQLEYGKWVNHALLSAFLGFAGEGWSCSNFMAPIPGSDALGSVGRERGTGKRLKNISTSIFTLVKHAQQQRLFNACCPKVQSSISQRQR